MDYKEEYQKALERAKQGLPIDKVFPELKESEDERMLDIIRKAIYTACDEETEKKVLSWLERQKENLKSCDSIPSDCVSDAKCKDGWHKVTDSFPDSAREVICKEAIGNFFIGRYYKGGNSWEVSMYDDMEKSNEDNPPVVMWCDIPSEKQKEQKPAEWDEEDEANAYLILKELEQNKEDSPDYSRHFARLIDWFTLRFKSLRPQPDNMIQWTGENLKQVIDFTGKSPKFNEWFKSWEDFENYVHGHGDILKLFCEDGSHYEVPVGAWIVKTPDGYNVPSVARFIHAKQGQPEVDLEKLGGIARHLIAVKDHEEDMRLDEGEWLLLERIGYPESSITI